MLKDIGISPISNGCFMSYICASFTIAKKIHSEIEFLA